MKWLFTTLAICSVSLCLLAATGCSNDARNSTEELGNSTGDAAEGEAPDQLGAAAPSEEPRLAKANWALDAEPGAVRLHQRVDPVTGRKIEFSEEQSTMNADDGLSPLERQAAKKHQDSWGRLTTFGDPAGKKVQAVR